MSSTANIRALLERFYALFEGADPSDVDAILAPSWRNHPADDGREPTVAGFLQGVSDLRAALEGLRIDPVATVVEGDLAVRRSVLHGVHVAPFGGYPPTRRRASFAAMDMHRIEDGRIVETWHFERIEMLAAAPATEGSA